MQMCGGDIGLINGSGDTTATTVTGVDGFYQFSGLTPGVQYQVQFAAPAGYVFTGQDIGPDVSDSDRSEEHTSELQSLTNFVCRLLLLKKSVYQYASLGDRLWVDANATGQQDLGEVGISGQTVTLIGGGAVFFF